MLVDSVPDLVQLEHLVSVEPVERVERLVLAMAVQVEQVDLARVVLVEPVVSAAELVDLAAAAVLEELVLVVTQLVVATVVLSTLAMPTTPLLASTMLEAVQPLLLTLMLRFSDKTAKLLLKASLMTLKPQTVSVLTLPALLPMVFSLRVASHTRVMMARTTALPTPLTKTDTSPREPICPPLPQSLKRS